MGAGGKVYRPDDPSDRYLTDEEKEQRTTVQEENGYKVGDDVMVDLPTGTIEGTIGYIGETDVRIDTSAHGQSWDNEVINKRQFEDGLRQNEPSQRVDEMLEQAETIYKESEVPEYERFFCPRSGRRYVPAFCYLG